MFRARLLDERPDQRRDVLVTSVSSKASRLSETLWAVLMLICIALVVLHLVDAVRAQSDRDESLIEHTFTSAGLP